MVNTNSEQTTDTILMVSPDSFSFNHETAGSNSFQNKFNGDDNLLKKNVLDEFNDMVNTLRTNGVNVIVLRHTSEPLPDAVFPNNWFSTDDKGNIILYPMLTGNRRKERDINLLKKLLSENNIGINKIIDISSYENKNMILEGTGSLVIDHINNAVFAIESERTSRIMFDKYCEMMSIPDINRIFFHANDESGKAIYHTNVILSIGKGFAVICDECIPGNEKALVLNKLKELQLEIITINYSQMNSFCGNILNIHSVSGESLIMMSKSAFNNFTAEQKSSLEKYGRIIYSDINTIEIVGGGSARCMMAEIFLKNN